METLIQAVPFSAVQTSTTLNNGKEAIMTEDMLVACAVLVASGRFDAQTAVNTALKMHDILVERLRGLQARVTSSSEPTTAKESQGRTSVTSQPRIECDCVECMEPGLR